MPTFFNESSPLKRYGHNLTLLAKLGTFPPLAGSEAAVTRIFQILLRRRKTTSKCNPVIVDLDGTTRWPIAAEVIRRMAVGEASDLLPIQQVIALDYEALFSNLSDDTFSRRKPIRSFPFDVDELDLDKPESWEVLNELFRWPDLEEWVAPNMLLERLQSIFIALHQADGQVLLFVDHLHRLLEGEYDAANLLKPTLARGQIQLMGACTLAQYRQHIERNAAMQRRFQEVLMPDAL